MQLSYELQFDDGSTYQGNSLKKEWNSAPDKAVKKMVYFFGTKKIVLEGFRYYHHLVEKVQKFGMREAVTQILLIGRKDTESHLFVIDFKHKKVFKEVVPIGKEYQVLIRDGWKKGV